MFEMIEFDSPNFEYVLLVNITANTNADLEGLVQVAHLQSLKVINN